MTLTLLVALGADASTAGAEGVKCAVEEGRLQLAEKRMRA